MGWPDPFLFFETSLSHHERKILSAFILVAALVSMNDDADGNRWFWWGFALMLDPFLGLRSRLFGSSTEEFGRIRFLVDRLDVSSNTIASRHLELSQRQFPSMLPATIEI